MTPIATLPSSLPVAGTSPATLIRCHGLPAVDRSELPGQVGAAGYRAVHECRASFTWTGPCRALETDAMLDGARHDRFEHGAH